VARTAGLLGLLAYGDAPAPRPEFIPDSWVSVSAARFSIPTAYAALKATLHAVSPPLEAMVQQQIAGLNKNLGVDLERDLIGSFGDEVVAATPCIQKTVTKPAPCPRPTSFSPFP